MRGRPIRQGAAPVPATETRLLAIGDIHLGRRSGRIPGQLDAARLDPAAALDLAVRTARNLDVAAVLLAGDVIDTDHDPFLAVGLLAGAVAELHRHGIEVLAVAGNHDAAVLPRAVDALAGLRILGRDGRWDEVTIGDAVRVRGWSFPGPRHQANPLAGFPPIEPGPPVIGLLHADLGARSSAYAPVTPGDLAGAGDVRWLLGHLHQPTLDPGQAAPGYLGSLVGLDPTETGPHGPWLIRVRGEAVSLEHLPQAPLCWLRHDLSIDDVADPMAELPELVSQALHELAGSDQPGLSQAEAVGVRLRLVGRAADLSSLEQVRRQLEEQGFTLPVDQQQFFLDSVTSAVRPLHDLSDLAARDDLAGLLARDLLALEGGAASAVLEAAAGAVAAVDHQSYLRTIVADHEPPDRAELRAMLLQHGYRVLDALLLPAGGDRGAA
jgi:hypothetical protein